MPVHKAAADEHQALLSKRFREISRNRPELRELRRVLIRIGGHELIPSSGSDPMTNFLIDFGLVFAGPVLLKPSGRRAPEEMLRRIWNRRLHGIVGIGAGYALNDDDIWREHSFGVLREGVLETAAPRRKYFGLLLISHAADAYCESAS